MNIGNDLKLSDLMKIKTPFCFLDETGLLNSERDRFFSIGMIKCPRPYEMLTNCKKDLLEFIKNKIGADKFTRDVRVENFNIKLFS